MAARLPTLLEHEAYDDERLPPEIRRKSSEAMLNVDELELKEEVGRGGFSQVYRAVYKGTEVAVKKMPLVDKDAAKYLDSEIAILKCVLQRCSACRCGRCVALGRSWLADTLRAAWFVSVVSGCRNTSHPSLIKYYGAAIKGKEVYIVTEFMNGGGGCFLMVLATRGYEVPRILLRERLPSPTYSRVLAQTPRCRADLSTILSKHVDVPLPWRLRCRIARDALQGIVALHENECIHRDIKSENFLVRAGCGSAPLPCAAAVVLQFGLGYDAVTGGFATVLLNACATLLCVCPTAVRASRSSMTRGGAWWPTTASRASRATTWR